jgi:type II secretory pathway pseudopilin PulG
MYCKPLPPKGKVQTLRGFGLIELIVSISIIVLIMGVVLVRNSAFSSAVVLRNQAYDVAFALRQAQQLAVSSNTAAAGAVQRFGVHMSAGTTSVIIFRDINNDAFFTPANDTIIQSVRLDEGFFVRDMVDSTGGSLSGTALSVTFTRPNFDAVFRHQATGGALSGPINIEVGVMGATGPNLNAVRWVEVTSTGQVAVTTHSSCTDCP